MSAVPAGEWSVQVEADPLGGLWLERVTVEPEGVTDLGALVLATGSVAGRVVDSRGAPVAGALVTLENSAGGHGFRPVARADTSGRFETGGIPAGSRRMRAETACPGPVARVEVVPGERLLDLELVAPQDAVLVGILRGEGGGLAGERVEVGDGARTVVSEAGGRFRIEGLEPGRQLLSACGLMTWVELVAGRERAVEIDLAGEVLGGRVTWRGAPLAGAEGALLAVGGPSSRLRRVEVLPGARFRTTLAGAGPWLLLVGAAGSDGLFLAQGSETGPSVEAVVPDGELVVHIDDPDAVPDDVQVSVVSLDGFPLAELMGSPVLLPRTVEGASRLRFHGIPRGARLRLEHESCGPREWVFAGERDEIRVP